jgi:hypothetical protein
MIPVVFIDQWTSHSSNMALIEPFGKRLVEPQKHIGGISIAMFLMRNTH